MKEKYVQLRIDEEEKKKLKQDAKRLGLSVSAYLVMLWKKDQESRIENTIRVVKELQKDLGNDIII